MRRLILYTLLFITPFIVSIIVIEYLLRKIPNSHMVKADEFQAKMKQTKIIILGNSHAANAINPDFLSKEAYNLAQGAQTLNIDYALLSKYQDQLDSLEYIIISMSYHSPWFKLSDLEYFKWMGKYNNIYFDINIEHNPLKMFLFLDEPIKKDLEYIKLYYWNKRPITFNYINGFMPAPPASDLKKIEKHAKDVAQGFTVEDLTLRYNENLGYLTNIIEIAKKKHSKVIFITTPCYPTYIDNLNKEQLGSMHRLMDSIQNNEDVFYYDFLEDARSYTLEDFNNGDHLSYLGAQKVTFKIDSIIKKIEAKNIGKR